MFRIHLRSRVISTPAPSANVIALGFSMRIVIWGTGKDSRAVVAMSAARASSVWKVEGSTTCNIQNLKGKLPAYE